VQLAGSLEAGLSLERSIAAIPGPPTAARESWRQRLLAGEDVATSMENGARWLPAVDRQLIAVAASAGRLPEVVRRLAKRHEDASRATRAAVMASLYPLAVAHLAVLVFPIGTLVGGGGLGAYAWAVGRLLLPLWVVLSLAVVGTLRRWRVVTVLLDTLPLVGGFRRYRALADLAFVLEAQVTAGVRLDVAWLQAAVAAGDQRLEAVAIAASEAVQRGAAVSTVLAGRRELPAPFFDFYANGEQTGQLDASLGALQRHFADAARGRLTAAAVAYPMILFLLVAVSVAVAIIRFYAAYFRQFDELM
jgi:type II secretory pathway component PulF